MDTLDITHNACAECPGNDSGNVSLAFRSVILCRSHWARGGRLRGLAAGQFCRPGADNCLSFAQRYLISMAAPPNRPLAAGLSAGPGPVRAKATSRRPAGAHPAGAHPAGDHSGHPRDTGRPGAPFDPRPTSFTPIQVNNYRSPYFVSDNLSSPGIRGNPAKPLTPLGRLAAVIFK